MNAERCAKCGIDRATAFSSPEPQFGCDTSTCPMIGVWDLPLHVYPDYLIDEMRARNPGLQIPPIVAGERIEVDYKRQVLRVWPISGGRRAE